MVYKKSLQLSLGGSSSVSAGKLVNFMSTDPANMQQMVLELFSMFVTSISVSENLVVSIHERTTQSVTLRSKFHIH